MLLDKPIAVRYADRSTNPKATVSTQAHLTTEIDGKPCQIQTLVTELSSKDMILGIPFLEQHNLDIDWNQRTFKWRETIPLSKLIHSMNTPTSLASITLNLLAAEPSSETLEDDPRQYYDDLDLDHCSIKDEIQRIIEVNYKSTKATELAKTKPQSKAEVPKKFKQYTNVFDTKKSE
jgi:hypothetical protein